MDASLAVKGTILLTLLLFIPGLAVCYAIFPRREDLDLIERVGFSFIFGLTPPLLLYAIGNAFLIPVTSTTAPAFLLGTTIICLIIWRIRLAKPVTA